MFSLLDLLAFFPCWRGFVTRANKNTKEAQVTDLR